MDRRKSLKLLATGAIATPLALGACTSDNETKKTEPTSFSLDRNPDELIMEEKLLAQEKFFTPDEMAAITILVDIIIPKDEISGSASEAGVPAFIEFIVKDMPQHQVPLRGGLRWLELYSIKTTGHSFVASNEQERLQIIDKIAFPAKASKEVQQGVRFFSLLRDLTATGFYTSSIGVKDLDYQGNQPNRWDGVPSEVLDQYGLAYSEKDLKDCIRHDDPTG
ncbi:MAG: gluconate 2-dehydrogenase subunit 3 family protein [Sphingomonadales bacterium]|nr:gluconate 2-dehydrogenase subunit 3 family protein [Sphingomonadales bacterium]